MPLLPALSHSRPPHLKFKQAQTEHAKQRYELHAQLTEVHRRCEDLQSQSTKAELLLQVNRENRPATYQPAV